MNILRELFRIPGYTATLRTAKGGTIRTGSPRHQLTKAQKKRLRRFKTAARVGAAGTA